MRTVREIDQEMAGLRLRVRMLKKERREAIRAREAQLPILYRSGVPLKIIGAQLGISESQAAVLARKLGLPARIVQGQKHEAIIEAWKAGELRESIALRLGTSTGQVNKVVRAHGLPPRPRGHRAAQQASA